MCALKASARVASFALFCLTANPAQPAPADPVPAAAESGQRDTLVVRVIVNGEDKGDLFVERVRGGDFLLRLSDLKTIGFSDAPGPPLLLNGESYVSLRSIPGVTFAFQESELALNITAPAKLLTRQSIGSEAGRSTRAFIPTNNSIFANYALTAGGTGSSARPGLGFSGEVGWRVGGYLLHSTMNSIEKVPGKYKLVRLMSSATHDDRQDLRRIVVGDLFTPSRDLSSSVNLGGISVSKLFGLNPYFVQYPSQSITGNVGLASDIDVYLDGQRIRSERVKPGEFELRDIMAYSGARNIQVLVRDAFGRVQQLDYSFYFSDQPLRQGLHEYSYNLGAFRRQYGVESNRYGPGAVSMFHRYGLTNAATLGLRVEATKDLFNGGPIATLVLGTAGVISVTAAASSIARRHGAALQSSYSYQSRNWSLGVWGQLGSPNYATLGDPPVITNRRAEGAVTLNYLLPNQRSVSFGHSFLATRTGAVAAPASLSQPFTTVALDRRRNTTLSYHTPVFSGWTSFTARLSHIKDSRRGSRNEIHLALITSFGTDYSAIASHRSDPKNSTEAVQLSKQQPVGEGLGFILSAEREKTEPEGRHERFRATTQYNAPAMILRTDIGSFRDSRDQTSSDYRLSVAGGVGYAGGAAGFGRPITDSFGIVKVGEVAGVGVTLNAQPMGKTNDQGVVFLPALSSYSDSEVALVSDTVPIEYSLAALTKKISPSLRSGAVLDFGLLRVQALTGRLKHPPGVTGKSLDLQDVTLMVDGKAMRYRTGRAGEFYIENLSPGTYAGTVELEGTPCRFGLVVPKSQEVFVDLGDVVCH